MNRRRTVLGYILLSVLAAAMLSVMAWDGSQHSSGADLMDRVIVCLAFMSSCVWGIIQSYRPGRLRCKRKTGPSAPIDETRPVYVAHHPNCGRFDDRVVAIRGGLYCGGCLGLLIGSLLSLMLAVVYLLTPGLEAMIAFLTLSFGIGLVALCLIEIGLDRGAPWSHVVANVLLVLGFFLVTIGVLDATGTLAYGLVAIIVCYLWLDTRIQLSDYRHAGTCYSCGRGCGYY
ncbi:MAG: hypothetical protein LUQ16_04510 [Methanomassiliicoccales archaeon]|nr:hypothetical protein [Methanomassiliicoccales archaeon]MDD1755391.1 hypothetical protein [Methanomassiliicoccales archaeon]